VHITGARLGTVAATCPVSLAAECAARMRSVVVLQREIV
jgi:hypothetical protein